MEQNTKKKKNVSPNSLKNLRTTRMMSPEERKDFQSRGGKASAAARHSRKLMGDELKAILNLPVKKGNIEDEFDSLMDAAGKNVSAQTAMVLAMVRQAMKGNERAFALIRDTIGEKPVEMMMEVEPPAPFAEVKVD